MSQTFCRWGILGTANIARKRCAVSLGTSLDLAQFPRHGPLRKGNDYKELLARAEEQADRKK